MIRFSSKVSHTLVNTISTFIQTERPMNKFQATMRVLKHSKLFEKIFENITIFVPLRVLQCMHPTSASTFFLHCQASGLCLYICLLTQASKEIFPATGPSDAAFEVEIQALGNTQSLELQLLHHLNNSQSIRNMTVNGSQTF
ncbi:hypothetical protein BcDW1_7536 [Botrytis cinerea BcDW1]|uniref:Uncharacterized protein n=1 Tax=Botryotinia fuckeliana (strain BcDW1) TaxID=1290391 RepID=M7TRA1_BOTF1|nr:hypothetical protein BcDW1_7536 [Botrytis cinerea BcDW1]